MADARLQHLTTLKCPRNRTIFGARQIAQGATFLPGAGKINSYGLRIVRIATFKH